MILHRSNREHAIRIVQIVVAIAVIFPVAGWSEAAEAPAARPVRVLVWDERQPEQKPVYPDWIGNHIAGALRAAGGIEAASAGLDDPDQGLGGLEGKDVLIWWGHVRHPQLRPEAARDIVARIESGKLALIALHASHWSRPFVEAMNVRARADALAALAPEERASARIVESQLFPQFYTAPKYTDLRTPSVLYRKPPDGPIEVRLTLPCCCFPGYRADGKPSEIRVLRPEHPIARGLPARFPVAQTEMYGEPFHVPPPDEVVLEERWATGEWFRSGMVWRIGKGRVFYFRPGHETYPVYKDPNVLKVIENAVRWLGGEDR
jgi:trehalose utilization protein